MTYRRSGKEAQESAKTTDRQKAERLLTKRLGAVGQPNFVDPRAAERLTFAHLAAMIESDYRTNGKRWRPAKRSVDALRAMFGLDRALHITADRIAAYAAARLAAGKKPATINRELSALRRMFNLAIRAGRLAGRPHIQLLAERNTREGFVDPPTFTRLLAALRALDAPDVADAAEFAYLTCLRRGNALGAVWSWFTLRIDGGTVTGGSVRLPGAVTKNKKPLPLVLTGQLLALVARRWTLRVPECPFVFHRNGQEIRDFRATWAAACEAVGLPGLLFHDLRRSAARNYRRAGVTEEVIMRIGGWKTPSMFARYNVVDERDLAEAATRLSGFLEEASSVAPTIIPLARRARRAGAGPAVNLQLTDNRADFGVAAPPAGTVSY